MTMRWASYPSLEDRAVFVTGGGSGIGASVVEHLCAQRARVAFVDIQREVSQALVKRIEDRGVPAPAFIPCDLRDIEALRAAVEEARALHGPARALVNNAAHDERHSIESVTPQYWDDRFAVNLRHQFFAAQAVVPAMAEAGGGSIINFGSTSWLIGQGGMPAYLSAKAAVAGLTRALARDLGPKKIRVNAIVPGWIMTERQITLWLTPEGEEELLHRQCLKRRLLPEDIARVVLFLAADDSDACTNQSYIVDGGWV
jgi:NAD(P)-dependent dehydrogenase (short-subunit alcohol dehydrogenase family)